MTETTENQPNFQILKLYVKEASFLSLLSASDFSPEWKPELQVEIHANNSPLPEKDTHEVVLHVKCVVSSGKKKSFEAECDYAGIFTLNHLSEEQLEHTLGSYCPSLLYPYLREVIANLVLKGGYPQLNLAPINFDLLFEQQKQKKSS